MADLTFHSYRRSQAAAAATPTGGRLKGHLDLTLAELNGAHPETLPLDFLLMGPGDVSGLKPGAVRRTYPANGAFNVETDKSPYAEFAAEDLPWRYSPDPNGAGMRPWLLLIVGTADEVTLLPGNRVVLSQGVVNRYRPAAFGARPELWAHAQEHDGAWVSRLLSPTPLQPSRSYVAVLVPAFDATGALSLPVGTPIAAYYAWRFATSDTKGSFVDLAKRLFPLDPVPHNVGMAPLAYQMASNQATVRPTMLVGGALVGLTGDPPAALPDDVRQHFAAIRPAADTAIPRDNDGRPLVQLPFYGQPWLKPGEPEPAWMAELNDDPRLRGVAGLGMWAGIAWQDRIVEAASKQLGAFYTAARRIRQLTAGLAAARSLWDRRLPTDDMHRLQVLGLAMSRLAATQGGSVLDRIAAPGRPMPPAFFSSAGRRMLRPGSARGRLVRPGTLAPAALLDRMNTCPPDPKDQPAGLLHVDQLCDGSLDGAIGHAAAHGGELALGGIAIEGSALLHKDERREREEAGLDDDNSWLPAVFQFRDRADLRRALFGDIRAPYPTRACENSGASLPKLSVALRDAFDPHGDRAFVIQRVLATIQGLDDQPLTPPELCLDFEIPAWKFLNEFARDWLLPGLAEMRILKPDGAGQLVADPEKDPVIAVETNGRFTDAFLVGLNQQALAELRWRNVPVAVGCTPLRRFWESLRPNPPVGDGEPGEDIIGIHRWAGNSPLGDSQHETPEASGDNLVLVFKSQLWRRYPETLIYLLPSQPGPNGDPDWNAAHLPPNLHVEIDRDVVAFGFPQHPSILDTHWVVVEQVPRGLTFYNQDKWPELPRQPDQQPDSARFATAAFARPVRVLIRGTELKPQP